jgi:hypothetical protein
LLTRRRWLAYSSATGGDLAVEAVAAVLGAQHRGAVGERGPAPQVAVREVVIDQQQHLAVHPGVDRVERVSGASRTATALAAAG